jgi:hypothetical protein
MANRKTIIAMINGVVHIDPSDMERSNIEVIKQKVKETFKKDVPIVVAPIQTWMPASGTQALINEAMKDLGIQVKKPNNTNGIYGIHKKKR